MSESQTNSGGVGFFSALTLIFVTLKLCGVIDWSWWWVLSPMLAKALIVILVAIVLLVLER